MTASPRPTRWMAEYRDRFMVPKTTASSRTGHHCCRVRVHSLGLTTGSSTAAATNCRTATTPTGPIPGKASEPLAAPSWLDKALATSVAVPPLPAAWGEVPSIM